MGIPMDRKSTFLGIIFAMMLCFTNNTAAFDDQITHPAITDKALKQR